MKPIEQVYPEASYKCEWSNCGMGFSTPSNYQPMLESLGFPILVQEDDDDYQGDSRLLLSDPGTPDCFGILIFGWGSCSGCDALQACGSYREIDELRSSLLDKIVWRSRVATVEWASKAPNSDWDLEKETRFRTRIVSYFQENP